VHRRRTGHGSYNAAAWDNATVEKAYSTILKVSALSQALGLAPLGEGQHSPSNRSRLSVG
jgi:hypothetical protein